MGSDGEEQESAFTVLAERERESESDGTHLQDGENSFFFLGSFD